MCSRDINFIIMCWRDIMPSTHEYHVNTLLSHDITLNWYHVTSKLQVSFAEYRLFYRALLQKRSVILRSLSIVATPYHDVKELTMRYIIIMCCSKSQVSFAEYRLFYRALLQKRPVRIDNEIHHNNVLTWYYVLNTWISRQHIIITWYQFDV